MRSLVRSDVNYPPPTSLEGASRFTEHSADGRVLHALHGRIGSGGPHPTMRYPVKLTGA